MVAPAFWVNYRGNNDPRIPLNTTYTYNAYFFYAYQDPTGGSYAYNINFTLLGPTQLTKSDYMEFRWLLPPGITAVNINQASPNTILYHYFSKTISGGFRDEGQYISSGGVLNQ